MVVIAFVAQADELTICDGNAECQYSPFYGLKMEDGAAIFPLYESEANLPKVTFTYDNDSTSEPIETCTRPECCYSITGFWEASVELRNNEEGATVYYRVYRDDVLIKKSSFTGDTYSFSVLGYGLYNIVAIAKKDGMHDSPNGGVFFELLDLWQIGPSPLRGDVNISSSVNMDDLTDLINYLVTEDATRISLTNADCEQDGKVSMDDLTTLINYLVFGQWPD